jgi:hypothetical protein
VLTAACSRTSCNGCWNWAPAPIGHRLKLLLDRLEDKLELVRETIRRQPNREAVNQQFIGSFFAELQHMRAHPPGGRDALSVSHQMFNRLVPLLKRLAREVENGSSGSLFG